MGRNDQMKVYINRLPVDGPWGGGNQWITSAHKLLPKLGHSICQANLRLRSGPPQNFADVVLIAGLDGDMCLSAEQLVSWTYHGLGPRHDGGTRLIIRVNENDARKGTTGVDKRLVELSGYMDGTVFVSRWLQEYFVKLGWKCTNNTVIKNGVDSSIFYPREKFYDGKIHIASHHWSNNPGKGFDIYEEIDKFVEQDSRFAFTYIGRDRGTFKNTRVVAPLYGHDLGNELGKHDVYVSASRWDPGPNHIAESIFCELPTYVHENGGGCVEFAGQDHVYKNWEELEQLLLDRQFAANSTSFDDWQSCIRQYVEFVENITRN